MQTEFDMQARWIGVFVASAAALGACGGDEAARGANAGPREMRDARVLSDAALSPESDAAPTPENDAALSPENDAALSPENDAAPAPEPENDAAPAPAPENDAAPAPENDAAPAPAGAFTLVTLAGDGQAASADGQANFASFNAPTALAVGADGVVYIAESSGAKIRALSADGFVSTVAGSGALGAADGAAGTASFRFPGGVAVDADTDNHCLRVVRDGQVRTLAGRCGQAGAVDGVGGVARFDRPRRLSWGADGALLVGDAGNHAIRAVSPAGAVTTVAGLLGQVGFNDGDLATARLDMPYAAATVGDALWVADTFGQCVRRVANGRVEALAGRCANFGNTGTTDGQGEAAQFNNPTDLCADGAGGAFIADSFSHRIRHVSAQGVVTTVAGSGPPAGFADGDALEVGLLNTPVGLVCLPDGRVLVADATNNRVRALVPVR
jgi:hypothetical protein